MKLKKLMRKNRFNFPEGVSYFTQDGDGTLWGWDDEPFFISARDRWVAGLGIGFAYDSLPELASNYKTKIVTRAEYVGYVPKVGDRYTVGLRLSTFECIEDGEDYVYSTEVNSGRIFVHNKQITEFKKAP